MYKSAAVTSQISQRFVFLGNIIHIDIQLTIVIGKIYEYEQSININVLILLKSKIKRQLQTTNPNPHCTCTLVPLYPQSYLMPLIKVLHSTLLILNHKNTSTWGRYRYRRHLGESESPLVGGGDASNNSIDYKYKYMIYTTAIYIIIYDVHHDHTYQLYSLYRFFVKFSRRIRGVACLKSWSMCCSRVYDVTFSIGSLSTISSSSL